MDRLEAMEVFVRLVEIGSFSKTAIEMRTTQPTVTKYISALETRLNVRLFNRNTRGVTPTEAGALYYDRCRSILRDTEEADRSVRCNQSEVQGMLRIGSSVAFGRRVIVPLALEFMAHHPQLRLDLSFEDRYTDLVAQGIDVAIRMGKLADSSLGARFLGVNPWLLAASPQYVGEHGAPVTVGELRAHRALIYSSVQGSDVWRLRSAGATPETVAVDAFLRSNNLSAVLAAARESLGVAALPWYVAEEDIRHGRLIHILPDTELPEQEIHAVYPSPKLVPVKVQAFIGFLKNRFEGDWWKGIAKV